MDKIQNGDRNGRSNCLMNVHARIRSVEARIQPRLCAQAAKQTVPNRNTQREVASLHAVIVVPLVVVASQNKPIDRSANWGKETEACRELSLIR